MMITDKDIVKLKEVFATKEEFTSLKDSLKNFATKDDLKNFATKEDLKNFATKDDFDFLKSDLAATKEMVEATLNAVNKIYGMFDRENKAIDRNTMETATAHHKLERHDTWIHHIAKETDITLAA